MRNAAGVIRLKSKDDTIDSRNILDENMNDNLTNVFFLRHFASKMVK